jgi:hypothetical protein
LGAFLCAISFGRWKVSLSGLLLFMVSTIFFFYSFGEGLSIGIWTFVGWGLWVTFLGGIILFGLTVSDLVNRE